MHGSLRGTGKRIAFKCSFFIDKLNFESLSRSFGAWLRRRRNEQPLPRSAMAALAKVDPFVGQWGALPADVGPQGFARGLPRT